MKKRIIALSTTLLLFTSVVSASSINGDYSGYSIVNVTSNGQSISSESVPAILFENEVLVPASILKSMGASVNWIEEEHSANISFISKDTIMKKNETAALLGARSVRVVYDEFGAYMSVIFDASNKVENDMKSLALLSMLTLGTDVDYLQVNYYVNKSPSEIVVMNRDDINQYLKQDIDRQSFISKWNIRNANNNNSSNIKSIVPPVQSTSDVIESSVDGDFKGFDGKTVIKLMNGQIWQQDDYTYHYHYAYMPEVTIYKDGSSYKMMVSGIDKKVKVKRLK